MRPLPLPLLLLVIAAASGRAQDFTMPDLKLAHSKSDPAYANASAANLDLCRKVAQELQDSTGYNFTGNRPDGTPGEGPRMIARAAGLMRSGSEGEIQQFLLKPMLGLYALMDPYKAIASEERFWEARGYGFSTATKKTAMAAFDGAVQNSPGGDVSNSGSRAAGFDAASDVLFAKAESKQKMTILTTAQRAYVYGAQLAKLYQQDSDSTDYATYRNLRDADLRGLGFGHTDKAVMGATAMTPSTIVPPGSDPVSGGWKLHNVNMFNGFTAAIVLDGAKQGLLPKAPAPEELKKAVANTDAQWGFSMLTAFTSPGNADYLNKLAAEAGQ